MFSVLFTIGIGLLVVAVCLCVSGLISALAGRPTGALHLGIAACVCVGISLLLAILTGFLGMFGVL